MEQIKESVLTQLVDAQAAGTLKTSRGTIPKQVADGVHTCKLLLSTLECVTIAKTGQTQAKAKVEIIDANTNKGVKFTINVNDSEVLAAILGKTITADNKISLEVETALEDRVIAPTTADPDGGVISAGTRFSRVIRFTEKLAA